MEKALKKSIEGGYKVDGVVECVEFGHVFYTNSEGEKLTRSVSSIVIDPLFWQALEKGLGRNSVEVVLAGKTVTVDAYTVGILDSWTWYKTVKGYIQGQATVNGKRIKKYLHRLIKDAREGEIIDHINGDIYDNRAVNLRIVDAQGNSSNKINTPNGKSRGVYWRPSRKCWQGMVRFKRKTYYSGNFKDKDEAIIETEKLRVKLFSEHYKTPVRSWWHAHWHRFIDHLAEGKIADDFFNNLMK